MKFDHQTTKPKPAFVLYARTEKSSMELTQIGQFYEDDINIKGYVGEIVCLPVEPAAYGQLFLAKFSELVPEETPH